MFVRDFGLSVTVLDSPLCLHRRWAMISMKDIAFYLSKGFEPAMAAYFANGRRKIVSVSPNLDFTLTLGFDNGESRLLDCKPFLLPGTVFAPFREFENFKRVYLDCDHCVCWDIDPNVDSDVVWSNKVDICPDSCYVDSVPLKGGEPECQTPATK